MKFDITQQSAFSTLVTLFVMSVIGLCTLLNFNTLDSDTIIGGSLISRYIIDFQESHTTLSAIISALLIFLSSVRLGHTVSSINLFGVSTSIHLYIICALLWCSVFGDNFLFSALLAAISSAVIGSLTHSLLRRDVERLFNSTLALSLLPVLYTPAIVLWIFIPFILMLIEVTLREVIITLVGLILPAAVVVYIHWLCGAEVIPTLQSWFEAYLKPTALFQIEEIPLFRSVMVALSLVVALISPVWIIGSSQRMQLRLMVVIFLSVASLMSIFAPSASLLSIPLLAPSLALLTSFSIANLRGRVANVLYFVYWILFLAAAFIPLDLPLC